MKFLAWIIIGMTGQCIVDYNLTKFCFSSYNVESLNLHEVKKVGKASIEEKPTRPECVDEIYEKM